MFTSGVHPDATAVAWMNEFEADNAIGLMHIVNLVLRSAGCDQEVTEDDVNDPDNASGRLNDLQEDEKGVCCKDLYKSTVTKHVYSAMLPLNIRLSEKVVTYSRMPS